MKKRIQRKKSYRKSKCLYKGGLAGVLLLAAVLTELSAHHEVMAEEAQLWDRYAQPAVEEQARIMAVENIQELSAQISKRTEWTDADHGNAKVTLAYQSDSGKLTGTKDMNIILIQDKSGSMDSNYGFKIQLERDGLSVNDSQNVVYFSSRNSQGWTESAEELVEDSNYVENLNYDSNGMDSASGRTYSSEVFFNSPCQLDGHYYLLVEKDGVTGMQKGTFIHGNHLYQISKTDLHHYRKLENREEALSYLEQGRRVVRAKRCYNEEGTLEETADSFYFLDISKIAAFRGKKYLSTVDSECEKNDRLARSQDFMEQLVQNIEKLNPNNKIAYIPFWGDVPEKGTWKNLSSGGSTTELKEDDYAWQIRKKSGVTNIGFTESSHFDTILDQIRNPFTYNGTNWTRALNKAASYLEDRNEEDQKRDTLIIFLTDGTPQGFSGTSADGNNPYINGEVPASTLKKMDNVSLYAVGVCINQSDDRIIKRVNQIDSSGEACFARTVSEFGNLLEQIENRIEEQYVIPIVGQDAFYTDVLDEKFSLDETKLDSSWRILDHADSVLKKGIPGNVYDAAQSAQVKCVYVRNAKTIYWKIGTMTDGTYGDLGHSMSFPVTYADYSVSTNGIDQIVSTNKNQRLSYVSSIHPEEVLSVSLSTPKIIFHRQEQPALTIVKKLEGGGYNTDQTYSFALCREEQSGTVKSPERTASVRIKAGNIQGQTEVSGLKPGVFYIYEVDTQGNIKNDGQKIEIAGGSNILENRVTLTMKAGISTLEKAAAVPASAVVSDGTDMKNYNNYLRITSDHATVSFTEQRKSGNLKVVKRINAKEDEIWWEHGNPIFIVRVLGTGTDGKPYTFYHTYEFTKEYVNTHRTDEGICEMSYIFEEIPISKEYRVEEVCSSRYHLTKTEGNGNNVKSGADGKSPGYSSLYAAVNLQEKPEGTIVKLYNEKSNYRLFSHTAHVENAISVEK